MPLHIPKFVSIAKYRYDVIVFLFAAILLSATLSGCLEAEDEVSEDLPPVLEDHGAIPETIIKGDLDRIEVELKDEDLQTVQVEVSVDDNPVGTEFALRYDEGGVESKFVVVTISTLDVGFHKIRISAEDASGQRASWLKLITITEDVQEGNEGEVSEEPVDNGTGEEEPVDNGTGEEEPVDNGTNTSTKEWWSQVLLCDEVQTPFVDDYNTSQSDDWQCEVDFTIDSGNITISTNGLPNHDFHSGPGCCASSQTASYTIPLEPTDDPDCNPEFSTANCTMAPERGAIAFAVNGVAIYGPEDGPGGDAVAGQEGAYEEDRQQVWLGLCHGHSGPGGEYHYHADSNCMHWHMEENQTWMDYSIDSSRTVTEHSPIIGFAFDGYPIYGFVGLDENGSVKEMKSSYRLKEGENGYNGIDDYEYIQGMGDLDSCNGQFGPTPEYSNGTYHYHTTWENGEGGIGFPYFINCYGGELSSSGDGGGDGDPCAGGPPDGDVWGPGIGPPPEGCGEGPPPGQMDSTGDLVILPIDDGEAGKGGFIAIVTFTLLFVATTAIRATASSSASRDLAGRVVGCHPSPR